MLALVAFTVIILVPFLKYPSNPPAVGADDTIGYRTQIYFVMLAISVAAAIAALRIGRDTAALGAWNGALLAVGAYLVLVVIGMLLMPGLNEIPTNFPADVIWDFRVATLGTHAVLCATLGLGFGALAERWLSVGRRSRYVSNIQPFRCARLTPDAHDLVAHLAQHARHEQSRRACRGRRPSRSPGLVRAP